MRQLLILCKLLQKYSLQIYIRRCVQIRKRLKVKCKWKGRKFEWASEWVNKQTNEIRDKERERKVWAKKKRLNRVLSHHRTSLFGTQQMKWRRSTYVVFFLLLLCLFVCRWRYIWNGQWSHIHRIIFLPTKKKEHNFFFLFIRVFSEFSQFFLSRTIFS